MNQWLYPFCLIFCFVFPACADVQAIYINGPSSSGKTTLAKALQAECDDLFLYVGFDWAISSMPDQFKDWSGMPDPVGFGTQSSIDHLGEPIQELVIGPLGKEVIDAYRQVVVALLKHGHKVVIDDLAFGSQEVEIWKDLLKNYSVLWVGLNAPLPVLEQREEMRSDRIKGSARNQYWKVHRGVSYDTEFDTSQILPNEMAERIAKLVRD